MVSHSKHNISINITSTIRQMLRQSAQDHASDHLDVDIYRIFHEEANLLRETADLHDRLRADAFGQDLNYKSPAVRRLIETTKVISCHRVQTRTGYSAVDAVVRISTAGGKDVDDASDSHYVDLIFRYERDAHLPQEPKNKNDDDDDSQEHDDDDNDGNSGDDDQGNGNDDDAESCCGDAGGTACGAASSRPPTNVWYSIHMAKDVEHTRQLLLWCQVVAPNSTPNLAVPAVDTTKTTEAGSENDEDGWSDIDSDQDDNGDGYDSTPDKSNTATAQTPPVEQKQQQGPSKRRRSESPASNTTKAEADASESEKQPRQLQDEAEEQDEPDCYYAGLDVDVQEDFLKWTGLKQVDPNMNDGAFVFLLLTFPFYEHEWDIVGFVLDSVFGAESSDDDDDEE